MDGPFIGGIKLFAGNFAPHGWASCDGTTLDINSHQALYSILGTQYGGDDRTNFQLPNLAALTETDGGTTPIRYIICLEGSYPSRN
jgi:microcystin-dependent protein